MSGLEGRLNRRYRGQTSAERQRERRALLIASAIRLYGIHGYRSTGVRAICQDAGLTERYFYESFKNGEALLLAAFEEVVRHMVGLLEDAAAAAGSPVKRVRALLMAYYSEIRRQPAAARVFLVEITGVSAEIDEWFDQSLIRLTEPLMAAVDPERVGPASAEPLLRRGIAGGILQIALEWIGSGYALPVERVVAAALPICLLASVDGKMTALAPALPA